MRLYRRIAWSTRCSHACIFVRLVSKAMYSQPGYLLGIYLKQWIGAGTQAGRQETKLAGLDNRILSKLGNLVLERNTIG